MTEDQIPSIGGPPAPKLIGDKGQLELMEALGRLDSRLARMYEGASRAFGALDNPECLAQCALSMREIFDKLHLAALYVRDRSRAWSTRSDAIRNHRIRAARRRNQWAGVPRPLTGPLQPGSTPHGAQSRCTRSIANSGGRCDRAQAKAVRPHHCVLASGVTPPPAGRSGPRGQLRSSCQPSPDPDSGDLSRTLCAPHLA